MERFEAKNELRSEASSNRPCPSDFDVYLPWACKQLQVEVNVVMIRVLQNEYVSIAHTDHKARGKKNKLAQSQTEVDLEDKEDKSTSIRVQSLAADAKIVRITTIYDSFNNLVQIKFVKNKNIPRAVLNIIGLIIKFHIHLTSLTINRGLDKYSIHEICKMLPKSYLTDLCLDGTYLENANYYLLLECDNCLKQISLARCSIDDEALINIAKKLVYPLPASKTLLVLNISSNRISDEGVKSLAEALKSNRQLVYLNLADNMITDEGAASLLDVLVEFPMSFEELLQSRQRYMKYLKNKKGLFAKIMMELKYGDERKGTKKKVKPSALPVKKNVKGLEKEFSLKCLADANKSMTNLDAAMFEKAENMALNVLGIYTDPYSTANITSKDGVMYCLGNNTLSYLNLSYTKISYLSLKQLLNVLVYQKLLNRKPRGLINLCIEGNAIPVACKELAQIDDILDTGLIAHNRTYSGVKKRNMSRGK